MSAHRPALAAKLCLTHAATLLAAWTLLAGWLQASPTAPEVTAARPAGSARVAVLAAYHGYNAPILQRALIPRGATVVTLDRWLDPASYRQFGVVVLDGSLKSANIEPHQFSPADLSHVQAFLDSGGTLVLLHQGAAVFQGEHGRAFLAQRLGAATPAREGTPAVRLDHPWVRHLRGADLSAWLSPQLGTALPASVGSGIIEPRPGTTLLHHAAVGKGQIIYVGWDLFRFRPQTRRGITPQQERAFVEQVRILDAIAADLFPSPPPAALPPRAVFDHPTQWDAAQARPLPPPETGPFASHPPTRPLPQPSSRPLGDGPLRFVDPLQGDDSADGSRQTPWRSVQHGVDHLQPGQTLVLRGGVYFEHVVIRRGGEPNRPLTVRSHPDEVAILDGSLREFFDRPAEAWEPAPQGAPGEYRSTRRYPDLPISPESDATNVLGRFADSLQPLHGYRFLSDLRSDNPFWTIPSNVGQEGAVYCGPGVWLDPQTRRIHCRLAHTTLTGLGSDNYRGQTDPRRLPLLIAGETPTLSITEARHLRLQDLVVRGSKGDTIRINVAGDVVLDGLTIFGGRTGVLAEYTQGLRVIHTAFRGTAAPWHFRSHLKYRAMEAQLFTAGKWLPSENRDFELAWCEFTDSVDGVFVGNVSDLRFHHNLVDRLSDDALFVTAMTDERGRMPGGPILAYQNRFSRCLTAIAFGAGHGRQFVDERGTHTGRGVWLCRNVFDLRHPVQINVPLGPDRPQAFTDLGRCQGDHGSPVWEPLFVYHNTIVAAAPAWRNYYLHGWGGHAYSTVRVLLNNLVVQLDGAVGTAMEPKPLALLLDGNVHHSVAAPESQEAFARRLETSLRQVLGDGPPPLEAFATPLRYPLAPGDRSPLQELLSASGQPLRGGRDRCGDPKLTLVGAAGSPCDVRLQPGSAALDAGIALPEDWFDPLDETDTAPDAGALPLGHDGWRVGVHGRFPVAVDQP